MYYKNNYFYTMEILGVGPNMTNCKLAVLPIKLYPLKINLYKNGLLSLIHTFFGITKILKNLIWIEKTFFRNNLRPEWLEHSS